MQVTLGLVRLVRIMSEHFGHTTDNHLAIPGHGGLTAGLTMATCVVQDVGELVHEVG